MEEFGVVLKFVLEVMHVTDRSRYFHKIDKMQNAHKLF